MDEALIARFWSRVDRRGPDECWPWTGKCSGKGYGSFAFRTLTFVTRWAHRAAWFIAFGHPGDLFVLHSCDNPPCCNPRHLFLGTNTENMMDMDAKGRRNPARGERSASAKLTAADVVEIRRRHAAGARPRDLEREYGMSKSGIRHILSRRKWKHVA